MALGIDDFKKERTLSVDDYDAQTAKGATLNKRTASQLSAGQTLLTGGTPDDYEATKTEIMDPESRTTYLEREQRIQDVLREDAREELPSFLADPSIEDEVKARGLQNLGVGFGANDVGFQIERPEHSSLKTLAENAIIADSGQHETARSAEGRNLFFESVQTSVNHKVNMTKMINELELEQGIVGMGVDHAEFFAPFAEWIHIDRLLKDVEGETDTGLLGQQKQKLFEHLKGLPLSKRAEMAESIVTIVENNENIVFPDGNNLASLEILQNMLVQNDYSDFERYFDNATSVLEVIGIGGLIRGVVKGGKVAEAATTVKRAETAAVKNPLQQEADEFVSDPGTTDNLLAKEASEFEGTNDEFLEEATFGNSQTASTRAEKELAEADLEAENIRARKALELDKFQVAREPTVDDVFRQAKSEKTRTDVVPTSPSQIVKDSNPELARDIHKMAVDDETGEAAQALYGTSREEVIAKDILPEPEVIHGRMPNKVEMRPSGQEDETVKRIRQTNGNLAVSEREVNLIKTKLTEGFEEVGGLVLHPSSMVARVNLDETIGFTARYSPLDSGFESPDDAIEAALVGFRNYGLSEDNFSILARRGDEWREMSLEDARSAATLSAAGGRTEDFNVIDYAIGLKYDYKIKAESLDLIKEDLDLLTTAPGLLARAVQFTDRIPSQILARAGQGSLVQNLLDAASVIHPQIMRAAAVQSDRTFGLKKAYVKQFEDFTNTYSKLPSDRRTLMSDYIHEANIDGLKLDVTDLYARGFNKKEIAALKQWRQANDTMWHAANEDMVTSLKAKGVKVFVHKGSDTKLMGRPVARGGAKRDVYDPETGNIVRLSPEQLDELYDSNGEVVKLMEPIEVNGRFIEQVASPNTPGAGYNRVLYEGENVLSYRDGYYPVMYDANHFVYKILKDSDGNEFQKVIGSARDTKEVKTLLRGIQKSEKLTDDQMKTTYGSRLDRRIESPSNALFDEGAWNVSANSGLSSQRVRGKRLQDAGVDLHKVGYDHLKDPLEAVANQIQNLSQRVSMRDYLDTVKKRWMINYGEHLELPKNPKTGQPEVPKNISQVVAKNGTDKKLAADARTNFNYISSLENGFINGMDYVYRGVMKAAAEAFGEIGLSTFERGAYNAAKYSPTQAAKTTAFKLFISGNPARQAILQRGQIMQIGANNPKYMFSGEMTKDWIGVTQARYAGTKNKKYNDLWKEMEEAGILDAVDAHTLIRDDMLTLAATSKLGKAKEVAVKPLEVAQKFGFDLAEQDVLITAWLSARDKAIRAGKDINSQRVKDEVLGETRAFTLDMNRAGEMPYSQNTLGLAAQFFSFRHKALLQPFTNRNLTGLQRTQLLAYTTAVFGLDAGIFYAAKNLLFGDEPSEIKDKIGNGLLDTTLNAALTAATGTQQAIDWGDLAPTEAYGMGNLMVGMLTTDVAEMVSNSPAGSLVFGASPRINDAMKTFANHFVPGQDYDDPNLQTSFTDVVHTSASMFSGYSNVFKARYAYETGQKMSSTGRLTDNDVTKTEAVMAAFGFRTKTETGFQRVAEIRYGDQAYTEDDVRSWYGDLKRHLVRKYKTPLERDMAIAVLGEAWTVFGDDRPKAVKQIANMIQKDATNRDYAFVTGMINMIGLETDETMWKMINELPEGNVRETLVQSMKIREEMLNEN